MFTGALDHLGGAEERRDAIQIVILCAELEAFAYRGFDRRVRLALGVGVSDASERRQRSCQVQSGGA